CSIATREDCVMRWTVLIAILSFTAACNRERMPKPGEQLSGLFLVRQNSRAGYVDKHGTVKITPQFEAAAPFSDGLAVVSIGGRAGYIDEHGKIAINPQFDSGAPFSEGLAAVRVGNSWGFIDKRGKMVIGPQFQDPGPLPMAFSNGLCAVNNGPG